MVKRTKVLTQGNKNWWVLYLMLISIFGVLWGQFVGVSAGMLYLSIVITGISLLFLASQWINEEQRSTVSQLFFTPITSSTILACGMYLVGWLLRIALTIIDKIKPNFSITPYFSPLYLSGSGFSALSQSFQAGVIESSNLGKIFYSVFVAGNIEEFVWAYALQVVFFIIAIGIVASVFKGKDPFGIAKKKFYMWFAILLSTLAFMYIHQLNGSYNTVGMFVTAGIFRLLTNWLIYMFGMTLSFTIGLHQANNTIAFIQQFGFIAFLTALTSSGWGWLLFSTVPIAMLIVIFNWEEFKTEFFLEIGRSRL